MAVTHGHTLEARVARMVQPWALGEGYYGTAMMLTRKQRANARIMAELRRVRALKRAKAAAKVANKGRKVKKVVVVKIEKK